MLENHSDPQQVSRAIQIEFDRSFWCKFQAKHKNSSHFFSDRTLLWIFSFVSTVKWKDKKTLKNSDRNSTDFFPNFAIIEEKDNISWLDIILRNGTLSAVSRSTWNSEYKNITRKILEEKVFGENMTEKYLKKFYRNGETTLKGTNANSRNMLEDIGIILHLFRLYGCHPHAINIAATSKLLHPYSYVLTLIHCATVFYLLCSETHKYSVDAQ